MAFISARLSNNERLLEASQRKDKPLAAGEKGRAIEVLQQSLIDLGIRMPISTTKSGLTDGIFGAETQAAVKTFQSMNGLIADGMAGPDTLGRLDVLMAERARLQELKLRAELGTPPPFSPWNVT